MTQNDNIRLIEKKQPNLAWGFSLGNANDLGAGYLRRDPFPVCWKAQLASRMDLSCAQWAKPVPRRVGIDTTPA